MKVDRKVELANSAILSISRHDDETKEVVLGALGHLVELIKKEADAFVARKDAKEAEAAAAEKAKE